jgi:hypothetical protein
VIPAPLRRKMKIRKTVLIKEEKRWIILEPSTTMQEAFGSGGKEMAKVAIEISKERRREAERERKKLSV